MRCVLNRNACLLCALLLIGARIGTRCVGKERGRKNYVLAAIPLLLYIRIQILNVRFLPQLWTY